MGLRKTWVPFPALRPAGDRSIPGVVPGATKAREGDPEGIREGTVRFIHPGRPQTAALLAMTETGEMPPAGGACDIVRAHSPEDSPC